MEKRKAFIAIQTTALQRHQGERNSTETRKHCQKTQITHVSPSQKMAERVMKVVVGVQTIKTLNLTLNWGDTLGGTISPNLLISSEPIWCFKYLHNMSVWQKQQREQAETENNNFKTQQESWVLCTYGPRWSNMERNCSWLTPNNPIYSCGNWLVGSKESMAPKRQTGHPLIKHWPHGVMERSPWPQHHPHSHSPTTSLASSCSCYIQTWHSGGAGNESTTCCLCMGVMMASHSCFHKPHI